MGRAARRGETPVAPARQVPPAPAHVSFPNTLYPRKNTWNGLQPWIVPQVKAICAKFNLTVAVGWSDDTVHKPRSDHKWGGAVDLAGAGGRHDRVHALGRRVQVADPYRPGVVFRWVGGPAPDADGVEAGHLDHVHLSWFREGPGTSIFTTKEFAT